MALLVRALALTLAAALLGLAGNALRSDGVRLLGYAPPASCEAPPVEVAPQVVDPAAAAGTCGGSEVLIADAREAGAYAVGHIAGAVHLPCNAGGRQVTEALLHLGTVSTVVVYGASTEEALPVAQTLARQAGQARRNLRILVIRGGFPAWEKAGLACASGPCDRCEEHPHR